MQGLPALHRLLASLVRTWVIAVVAVIACAAFAARAVGSFIAADVLTDSPQSKLPPAPPGPATPSKPTIKLAATDGRVLVDRNIFCSECQPAAAQPGDPADPQYSGAPATLIATSIGGDEPSATVHVLSTDVQGSWNLGDAIPGVGTIARVGPTSIDVVDSRGHRGRLSLLDSGAAGRTPGAATPVASAPAAAPRPFADSINKINDTTYEVKRALVRTLVSGGSNGGGVRAVPFTDKGEIKGIRLFGVKPESVAGELGLKSSDIISTIDGEPIKNVQQLLDLYAKLDNLDNVELGGSRAGKPITLALRLR